MDWQQIGGDVTASQYGATFGLLDTIGDKVYGVSVVKILYMPEHTEYDGKYPYYVTTYYCEVDDVELSSMRSILQSYGWLDNRPYEAGQDETIPENIRERLAQIDYTGQDYANLYRWQGCLNNQQSAYVAALRDEKELLQTWYSIPRMVRAEAMASYGGYETESYNKREYGTLADAMQSEGIPREALWHESEYNAVPDSIDADDGTQLD